MDTMNTVCFCVCLYRVFDELSIITALQVDGHNRHKITE